MHLTDVIHSMGVEMDHTQGREITDEVRLKFEQGWLWEEALSRAFGAKAAIRIGELEMDGIVGSPDGVGYDGNGTVYVEEYKCTSYSPNKTPADMWRWVMQVKGYCHMVGAVKCVFRILHLGFVNTYHPWELVFTEAELEENWASIVNHCKTMRR